MHRAMLFAVLICPMLAVCSVSAFPGQVPSDRNQIRRALLSIDETLTSREATDAELMGTLEPSERLERMIERLAFDLARDVHLANDRSQTRQVLLRWRRPQGTRGLRLSVAGDRSQLADKWLHRTLTELTSITGLEFSRDDANTSPDIAVMFHPEARIRSDSDGNTSCRTIGEADADTLRNARIELPSDRPDLLGRCISRQLLHALGLFGESVLLPSALSPAHTGTDLPAGSIAYADRLALQLLYAIPDEVSDRGEAIVLFRKGIRKALDAGGVEITAEIDSGFRFEAALPVVFFANRLYRGLRWFPDGMPLHQAGYIGSFLGISGDGKFRIERSFFRSGQTSLRLDRFPIRFFEDFYPDEHIFAERVFPQTARMTDWLKDKSQALWHPLDDRTERYPNPGYLQWKTGGYRCFFWHRQRLTFGSSGATRRSDAIEAGQYCEPGDRLLSEPEIRGKLLEFARLPLYGLKLEKWLDEPKRK
ncbi:MAG: hypothetical protein RJQ21_11380 [Rhodospirillales bacterium]